jgi:hypothetical protein
LSDVVLLAVVPFCAALLFLSTDAFLLVEDFFDSTFCFSVAFF